MASAAVQLGLLLPPSEGKALGGDGPTWAAGLGRFAELERRRSTLVRRLARVRGGNEKLLGVGGSHLVSARLANATLQVSPFAFYDQVSYWNDDTFGVQERTIASAGAGLRFEARGKGRLDVMWAKPFDPPLGLGEKTPGSSLLVNLTVSFDDAVRWGWSRVRNGERR